MGNPQFAVPSLSKLVENGISPLAIVTDPPKRKGRGQYKQEQPVSLCAQDLDLPLLQPHSLSDSQFVNDISELNPDLFVVVAFKILPKELLVVPKDGSINLHGSLLPAYRGSAPIQHSLMNGDTETGLTTFLLKPKVDAGDILLQEKVEIIPEYDFGTLSEKMSQIGSALLLRTVKQAIDGTLNPISQNDSLATPAPKIHPDMGCIDWNQSAEKISNLIRGLSPIPGAFSKWNGKTIKFFNSSFKQDASGMPGQFLQVEKVVMEIGTGRGRLEIREIQLEGKKRLPVEDFLRGSTLAPGDMFTS